MDRTLSQELLTYVETLDMEDRRELPTDQRDEEERDRRFVAFVVQHLIDSREAFLDRPVANLERLTRAEPRLTEELLDDYYTRQQLDAIPSLVRRTLRLSQLQTARIPSKQTNSYILEATRTYVYGLPLASISLSRAALEQGPKEVLGRQGQGNFVGLTELIREARKWNVLDKVMEDCAHEIRKAGDDVLHEKPGDDALALEVLTKVRGACVRFQHRRGLLIGGRLAPTTPKKVHKEG